MNKQSLTTNLIRSTWVKNGLIEAFDGSPWLCLEFDPIPSGGLEDAFQGPIVEGFFQKLGELLSKLPDQHQLQTIMFRYRVSIDSTALTTKVLVFEKAKRAESFSHLEVLLKEIGASPVKLSKETWLLYLSKIFSDSILAEKLPDLTWEKDLVRSGGLSIRTMSLTELPQVTWNGCFQAIIESNHEFVLSLKAKIPDRRKIKKQLETKRRVSHALSISSSLEVKNIESNSVLSSSEETLERILVEKETLFEISVGLSVTGLESEVSTTVFELERLTSGIGNAGLYPEEIGSLPVLMSHLPGEPMLEIRKLPILSSNLAHVFPILLDYSRANERSSLSLQSRACEDSYLNLFSKENLNFNSFICGASGSGKSFLMNAILSSNIKDSADAKICIFDIGGSYRNLLTKYLGSTLALNQDRARSLLSSFIHSNTVGNGGSGFFRILIESLCGSGSHLTHSHLVAIDDLLQEQEGQKLSIKSLIEKANTKEERFYLDIAHWLKPHLEIDSVKPDESSITALKSQICGFDFKELESDPILQKTTILLLSELLWKDLVRGNFSRTIIVFDEVWRFFAQSRSFLEEMYRTLRKYKAGIVSVTQNLADYGDDAFAKMVFTNSYTKIFLQNGASAEYLRETFDLSESDIKRAVSVSSKKPYFSEFFALTPNLSQVYRLFPSEEFYQLANTENISAKKEAH